MKNDISEITKKFNKISDEELCTILGGESGVYKFFEFCGYTAGLFAYGFSQSYGNNEPNYDFDQ
ncbi:MULTISPECIES: hypothetical protein [unclassified Lactococcus]|uniref:hypothetical protein n=1 Tax=unclassified Lactococcus TaxID=2643510 RepID=UPI0011CC723B|nr:MULTISPECIES: hypothetical protein [unclassified Lactococcus]MQW23337.1 hypothetical protein [Lactococcus sp. dk101]TXK37961.1 hypothetical protein FVP42_07185 [Lactococcus sp. dk310]TXK49615.1 hypothetical protein FVP43_07155 [Lactococcus sp. dk322]